MENQNFTHNLENQIIGEITYNKPYQFTFVYADNRRHVFDNIVKFISMKTGCYVLIDTEDVTYVIRQLHDYVIEKLQPKEGT